MKIANSLKSKDILFLSSHGVIVTGTDVASAWEDLYYLDRACNAQILAMSTGKPLKKINAKLAKTKKKDGKRHLIVQYDIPNRLFSNLYLSMKIDESVELPRGNSK